MFVSFRGSAHIVNGAHMHDPDNCMDITAAGVTALPSAFTDFADRFRLDSVQTLLQTNLTSQDHLYYISVNLYLLIYSSV